LHGDITAMYITDCPLHIIADKWTCPLCGWVYPLDSDKPPRRNCPASPEGREGKILAIIQAVQSACQDKLDWHLYEPRHLTDLRKIIGICLDCGEWDGTICRKAPRRCTWLKMLGCVGFRECERWSNTPGAPLD
jgi:hypothetical protein